MIYFFTGQPGHGKTLSALEMALRFRDEGRLVYVCNVRKFDYEKAKMLKLEPSEFMHWQDIIPPGAVVLVDECYEHGMLPKRMPGSKVPHHVEQIAKHRHSGIDFIFVCQSPKKQCDEFIHDLTDVHVHVRRQFGSGIIRQKTFDYYEVNPVKTKPTVTKFTLLPKRPMGLYESTLENTNRVSVPWYYPALLVVTLAVIGGSIYMAQDVNAKLSTKQEKEQAAKGGAEYGAKAKDDRVPLGVTEKKTDLRKENFALWLHPQIPSQPWTAPAYSDLKLPGKPPRIFCWISGDDEKITDCRCRTDQGTKYALDRKTCVIVVQDGQYEPFLDLAESARAQSDVIQFDHLQQSRGSASAKGGALDLDAGMSTSGIAFPPPESGSDNSGTPVNRSNGWLKN